MYAIIYLKNFCLKGFSIKKIYILCAWCALFIILTLATIFGQSGEMGEMGRAFAMLNLSWFGYLGYVYLLFLLYPAYALYKDSTLSPKRVKIIIAVLLLSLGVLLVQSLWLDKGLLGALLIAKIMPNFGAFGVWILVIVCVYARGAFAMSYRCDYCTKISAKCRAYAHALSCAQCKRSVFVSCS